ncbi:carbohydrate ABC transporter permease [Pelagibius sp.]|uniref:carbohydrate ABC transporter permease n=1 Tax=Pelagibius sp. TaxID=1931238 RepID=UPI002632DE37|nr:sugar ABC transporter permease [Pelagibius sp.]
MNAQASLTEFRGRTSYWYRNQTKIAPLLFLTPAIVMFLLFVVNPIIQSIWISFHEWDGLGDKVWIGFANYVELFDDELFYVALWNNVIWLVLFMLSPVIGLAIALYLNQKVWGIRLVKSLFFFPFVISQVVVGLVFAWFYDPSFGLLGEVFGFFGGEAVPVLSDERYVTYGIVAAGLWPQTAYCMILYLTGLNNLDGEVIEAARIDNAKGWSMLYHIILPQLRPATFIAVVVTVIGALRSFDLVAIMTAGGPFGSSTVLAYYMYEQSLFNYRMGYGAAVATILFLIMDVYIAFFLFRMLKQERRSS